MNDKYWRNNNQCYKCKYHIGNFFLGYCELAQDTASDEYCEAYYPNDEEGD